MPCGVALSRAGGVLIYLVSGVNSGPPQRAALPFDAEQAKSGPMTPLPSQNVLGGPLRPCSQSPVTGFFRNGNCDTCAEDVGCHTVCVEVTTEFLEFSAAAGNDLSTPRPEYDFPGLKPGDRWCVCAARWLEALETGVASPIVLNATHLRTLSVVPLHLLRAHATA
jgi:uncharacterized protein